MTTDRLLSDLGRFLRSARNARPDCVTGLDLVSAWIDGVRAGESAERNRVARREPISPYLDALAALREPLPTTPEPETPTVESEGAEYPPRTAADNATPGPIDPEDIPF